MLIHIFESTLQVKVINDKIVFVKVDFSLLFVKTASEKEHKKQSDKQYICQME